MKRSGEEIGMPGSIPGVAGAEATSEGNGIRLTDAEFIPTRTAGKSPRPPQNALQFVKVQSPLYIKAEQQIKLTKEVKICREALKEGEEEWQSNLDDWKSRRRKVSEKVIQRAEEMRQIEAEELLRKEKLQKKIKKFSEIVENKSSRSYNLDLYIGTGDDSGLGATPEPDETLESLARSDTSEGGMTSEAESLDSDSHKSEKVPEKEPPKVPQKPHAKFKRSVSLSYSNDDVFTTPKGLDLNSSTEPSDIEGHTADTEATSSEEDVGRTDSLVDDATQQLDFISPELEDEKKERDSPNQISNGGYNLSFKICTKHGDARGFGFTLKGGKDHGCPAYIENVVKGSPAEDAGLKNGDKIISINGELTDDYSHASLVFSIKQALYTGILDIDVNRSENCETKSTENAETKPIESRKGKSFAERLAIFTAGVIAPSVEAKSKSGETKKESLVLRRRSAFENGNADNVNYVSRRLSCISQSPNTSSEKTLEKRHSIDFALGQYVTPDSAANKKGPPPPIPAKPKFKTKPVNFEPNKPVVKSNETISSPPRSTENSHPDFLKESPTSTECSVSPEIEQQPDIEPAGENDDDVKDLGLSFDTKPSYSEYEVNDKVDDISCNETDLLLNEEEFIPDECDFDPNGSNATDKHSASFEVSESDVSQYLSGAHFFETIDEDVPNEFGEDSFVQESDITGELITFSEQLTNGVSSEHFDKRSTTEDPSDSFDICAENISKEIDAEDTSFPSACHSAFFNEGHVIESQDMLVLEDSEIAEYKNEKDTNSSLLGLSLEKIDEDDVISASTTTSSDTPDTETVIETLPSNLSPLPNDESNSEDFPRVLPPGTSSSTEMPSSETNGGQNYETIVETTEECLEDYNSVPDNIDNSYYEDQSNEEYAQELAESLDQITSLDIIDRIEQSLMDQLQKEDSYEDPLERDPWLYYSEESELIEDLTPRNLEPPREPPPPPPPPEIENKVMPINRTDSTKRIKKELLRRRSDFLGLQSPEPFHVDNIPPPPPLLEDLLKQETQWLENRSESLIENSSISSEPTCFETINYSSNDYSEYFVEEEEEEENTESPKESEHEQWKNNMVEESILDSTYGLQYKTDTETVIGNGKLSESPQHKVKQQIQNLGAAPKAKIMDSTQWILDKDVTEPQTSCNLNGSRTSRRFSMPPLCSSTPPDVTVRTWRDREFEYMQQRPTSTVYNRSCVDKQQGNKDRHSLDLSYETESDVHKCSCCGKGLCEGSAMGIEALRLYFHIECFRCCFCSMQLGNGSCGTDVQVKNNQLYCPSCFTVD